MVALFQFQADAVNTLLEQVRYKNKITLKSPTGSGKTIILAHFINEYLNLIDDTIRFIWLCPGNGELEQQSKDKVHSEFQFLKVFDLNDAFHIQLSNGAWIENQNIDKHSEQKFNALKNYLIKNKLKGGFIRKNQSGILCIAQTSYTEDMSGIDIWDDLNSVWK